MYPAPKPVAAAPGDTSVPQVVLPPPSVSIAPVPGGVALASAPLRLLARAESASPTTLTYTWSAVRWPTRTGSSSSSTKVDLGTTPGFLACETTTSANLVLASGALEVGGGARKLSLFF